MSAEATTYSILAVFGAINLIFAIYSYRYPAMVNERLRRAIETIENEGHNRAKLYIVRCSELRRKDAVILLTCIVVGSIFLVVPFALTVMSSWGNENPVILTLVLGGFNCMIAYIMPLLAFAESSEGASKILMITDYGFEVWKPKRKRTELAYVAKWNDVTDLWVNRRDRTYGTTWFYLFTKEGDILLDAKWPNVLVFLKDLKKHNPGVIQRAERYTRECLDLNLNDLNRAAKKML